MKLGSAHQSIKDYLVSLQQLLIILQCHYLVFQVFLAVYPIQCIEVELVGQVMVTDTDQWFWDPAIEWNECLNERVKCCTSRIQLHLNIAVCVPWFELYITW